MIHYSMRYTTDKPLRKREYAELQRMCVECGSEGEYEWIDHFRLCFDCADTPYNRTPYGFTNIPVPIRALFKEEFRP